jgi:hypothetical protein
VLWKLSWANLSLYLASIPSYNQDKKKSGPSSAPGDTVINADELSDEEMMKQLLGE